MIHSLNYAVRAKKIKLVVEANTFEEAPPAPEPAPDRDPAPQSAGLGESGLPGIGGYLEEIEGLRGKILELESQLQRERGGRSRLETSYNELVFELQEQWELRNSIVELGELQRLNAEKLSAKKRQLLGEDPLDAKKKRQLLEEARGLEDLVADNEAIKRELEKRLRGLEEKRAAALGLQNRSVSPAILTRARKHEEVLPADPRGSRAPLLREKTTEKKPAKPRATPGPDSRQPCADPRPAPAPEPAGAEAEAVDDAYPQVLKRSSSSQRRGARCLEKSAPKRLSAQTSASLSVYELILYDNDGPLLRQPAPSPDSSLSHVKKAIDFEEEACPRWPLQQLSGRGRAAEGPGVCPGPQAPLESSKGSVGDFSQLARDLQEVRGSSRELRIQEKLQKAREKMREFKKKIGLMKAFLAKYEARALEKCSLDIFKVVAALLQEQQKQNYLLTQEENQILLHMSLFASKFHKLHAAALRNDALLQAKENIRLDANQPADPAPLAACDSQRTHLSTLKSAAGKPRLEAKDAYLTTASRASKPEAGRLDSRTESILSRINKILG